MSFIAKILTPDEEAILASGAVYCVDGQWFKKCPECGKPAKCSTRRAAINRSKMGCSACHGHRNSGYTMPEVVANEVWMRSGSGLDDGMRDNIWYAPCAKCSAEMVYSEARCAVRAFRRKVMCRACRVIYPQPSRPKRVKRVKVDKMVTVDKVTRVQVDEALTARTARRDPNPSEASPASNVNDGGASGGASGEETQFIPSSELLARVRPSVNLYRPPTESPAVPKEDISHFPVGSEEWYRGVARNIQHGYSTLAMTKSDHECWWSMFKSRVMKKIEPRFLSCFE